MKSFDQTIEKYLEPDGLYYFSHSKEYKILKEHYDKFLAANTNTPIGTLLEEGNHLAKKMDELNVPKDSPAIEIGCGAGAGSRRLIAGRYFERYLFTDASKELSLFTRESIQSYSEFCNEKVDFGVLLGEDAKLFPENSVSAFFLFATLHHFVDWQTQLKDFKRSLKNNGIIFCVDPCFEFANTISILFLCFKRTMMLKDQSIKPGFFQKMDAYINASKFRGNPFVENKELAEDKHNFRIDALYRFAQNNGFKLYFYPNSNPSNFNIEGEPPAIDFYFFLRRLLTSSQHFEPELCDVFFKEMQSELEYLKYFWDVGQGPVCNFVAIFQKK